MQSEIVALRMKREELEKLREDCQSLMAPIRKLPTELLDHIFGFCCWDVASFFSTEGSDLVDAPAFTLSSVCAQWREIIRRSPKFWANLSLNLNPSVEDAYDYTDSCRTSSSSIETVSSHLEDHHATRPEQCPGWQCRSRTSSPAYLGSNTPIDGFPSLSPVVVSLNAYGLVCCLSGN
ncbi:hypothetical protein BT96DRAFT_387621 [Gymnopus androsaceus JB14]|uniref:Uncharacterized protein n=1 Tax=Gymnopus androsaceus JB14 TaxID=1447944 RepID=A0A6A4I518_9AGAR|nr:hypothetical protein BT96DRAFT_387621 [Gymnopus androsaceus JB14]